MTNPKPPVTPEAPTREERMAAKLRENLRRRKAQAREMGSETSAPEGLPKEDSGS